MLLGVRSSLNVVRCAFSVFSLLFLLLLIVRCLLFAAFWLLLVLCFCSLFVGCGLLFV